MQRFTLVSMLLLAAQAGIAQAGNPVSPPGYTQEPGFGASLVVPFDSRFKTQTFLQVCDDMKGRALPIQGISFRRLNTSAPQQPWSMTLSLFLSTANTTSQTISPTFAANHGQDRFPALIRAKLSFPAATYQPGKVQPWSYHLPFPRPFPFAGKGGLCLELRVLDQGIKDPWIYLDTVNLEGSFRSGGSSYQVPGQKYPAYCGSYLHYDSGSFWLEAYGGALPAGELAFWILGTDKKGYAGLKLPFDLSLLGLPSQSLYVAPLAIIGPARVGALSTPHQVNFTGSQVVRFPNLPGLVGQELYSQLFCTYSRSPYGLPLLFTTYSWNEVPPAPLSVSSVYDRTGGPGATIGRVAKNAGYVLRFNR